GPTNFYGVRLAVPKMRLSALVYRLKNISSGHLKGEFRTDQIVVATILQFAGTRADGGAAPRRDASNCELPGTSRSLPRTGPSPRLDGRFAITVTLWSPRSGS